MASVTDGFVVPGRVSPEEVRLRPLSLRDREQIRRWMADPAVVRFTVQVPTPECAVQIPYNRAAADRYLRALISDPQRRSFAIEVEGAHVGNLGLKDYDAGQRVAECFIEIGERAARRRGVARVAMTRLLDLALLHMDLAELTLGVFEFNEPALRLYQRLGFRDCGHYGWHWAEGQYWEVRRMRIDADQWAGARPED